MRRGLGFHARRSPGVFNPASLFLGGTVNGAWYDPSDATTLFSDRAGTTPCGTPGGGSVVPVGLMLDKSQGLVLGSELVTNGGPGFTTTTGWGTTNATVTASGGKLVCAKTAPSPAVFWTLTTVVGTWYKVDIVWENVDATSPRILVNSSGGLSITTTNTTATVYFLAVAASTFVQMELGSGSNGTGTRIISLSAKTVAGNHAIAANDTTARPELRARVNLLEYSEQFDNAYWNKGSASISANTNATTDPLGGNNADKLIEAANNAAHFVERNMGVLTGTFTASIYAKAAERTWLHVQLYPLVDGRAWFDLANGVLGTVDPAVTATITPAGNGWYKCTVSRNTGNTTFVDFYTSTGNNVSSYLGDGTSGIYIWGADLRPANIGTAMPAYQRISDANTYDAVGFPRYLACNGTSSAMSTPGNVNLSGTDKATVFAGVRKNDNTNGQFISELSAAANTNPGAFWVVTNLTAGGGASSAAYAIATNGTAFAGAAATGTTAPITNVLSGALKISTGSDNTVLRVNGTQVATSGATSSGTGNFGTYPLNIGARNNGAAFFLNGNIYSLIVVGSAVSAGQISATEQWVAQRTGITI